MMNVIEGTVEPGDQRGRLLGFPTANIALPDHGIDDGVWAALVRMEPERWAAAAVSVGRRRTFYAEKGQRLLEAHLIDVDEDLYGRKIRVEMAVKLRSQRVFPDIQSLTDQLRQDVQQAREWAASKYPGLVSPLDAYPPTTGSVALKMSYA
ncbi:riboflavin kinase [Arthrobacter sp. SLBN-112]|jgi:FAD synthase|uniref:riboflavin kinase n=1 Tax=Arthrobacter sp. SLBN-112 TaxID=2768452 RepID=UPI0027B4CC59|nr:riboflavin kinase [Arthrobacter sp. SLBN-112]MDQ0799552.1 FAD synthase [Arthrobacter sp. SLBN-112]